MRQTRIVIYDLKPLQNGGDYSSLPDDIVFNQFETGDESGTSYGTFGGASERGYNAYSLEMPRIYKADYESLLTTTTRPMSEVIGTTLNQPNFATVYDMMWNYSKPKITKEELARLFYIYEISDYGNQAASFNNYDFMVKFFINGYKIRQDHIGLLRCYTSKKAFVLLDRAYLESYSLQDVFIGEEKKDANGNIIVSTTATAVIIPKTFRNTISEPADKVGVSTESGSIAVAKLESYLNDNMPSRSFVFDCDDNASSATLRRADGILQELLRTDRFELLYKESDSIYRRLSSKYYETICASKMADPAFSRVSDSTTENGDSVESVSRQTFSDDFDYYKYVYRSTYTVDMRFGTSDTLPSSAHSSGIWYAALLDVFRGIDITKLFICDRSRLRDYWNAENVSESDANYIGDKTICDYGAYDMSDLTIYGLIAKDGSTATGSVNRPFRYRLLSYGKDYYFSESGRIVCVDPTAYISYELIPAFNSRFHAKLAGAKAVENSSESSVNVGGMLESRNLYGGDMSLDNTMVEAYADGRLVKADPIGSAVGLKYLALLPDNAGSGNLAASLEAITSMGRFEIDYDIPVGYDGGVAVSEDSSTALYDENEDITAQWDPNEIINKIGLTVDPMETTEADSVDSNSAHDYPIYDGSDPQVLGILGDNEIYAAADHSIHSKSGTETIGPAADSTKYEVLSSDISAVTSSLKADIYESENNEALEDSFQAARINMSTVSLGGDEIGGNSAAEDYASIEFDEGEYPPQFVQIDIDPSGLDANCVVRVFETVVNDIDPASSETKFAFENYGFGQLRDIDGKKRLIYIPSLGLMGETIKIIIDKEESTAGFITNTKAIPFKCTIKTSRSVTS